MIDTEERQKRALALIAELRDLLMDIEADSGQHCRKLAERALRLNSTLREMVWGSPR